MSTKELSYIYNNEAICAIAIYSVLKECRCLNYSKVALIPPIVFNNKLITVLNGKHKIRGVEELMVKKGELLTNFNNQYTNFLPLMCNTLILLEAIGVITITEQEVVITDKEFEMTGLGRRADEIVKSAPKIAILLREDVEKLYLQLRVIL